MSSPTTAAASETAKAVNTVFEETGFEVGFAIVLIAALAGVLFYLGTKLIKYSEAKDKARAQKDAARHAAHLDQVNKLIDMSAENAAKNAANLTEMHRDAMRTTSDHTVALSKIDTTMQAALDALKTTSRERR